MKENSKHTHAEIDERYHALITNASAIRAITAAVEGTLGPRGLDTMLVDRAGDIVITNDGVTILDRMEVSHPAARMLINIARAQHEKVGDGTTTATVMAGTLLSEGMNHIMKGVPVTRIIDGLHKGVNEALKELESQSIPVAYPDDPILENVAVVAGRGEEDIAQKVVQAAKILGREKLLEKSFKFNKIIISIEGQENEVFEGIVIKKKPVNEAMPEVVEDARILCLDDALDVEPPQEGSLRTESGFQLYMKKKEEFEKNVKKIVEAGVNVILTARGLSDKAEEILTDSRVLVVTRLTLRQLRKACQHTGATAIKKTALIRPMRDLKKYLGKARKVYRDRKLKNIRVEGGAGIPTATIIVGSSTREVVEEKERIAADAASAVQLAVQSGIVPGGGAVELAVSRKLIDFRKTMKGISSFGVDCVIEALKRPLAQIIQNSGFNPLEKVEEVLAAQAAQNSASLGIDCETGKIVDMLEAKIVDPTQVKLFALKAAAEVAESILRINTIIKMKDLQPVEVTGSERFNYR